MSVPPAQPLSEETQAFIAMWKGINLFSDVKPSPALLEDYLKRYGETASSALNASTRTGS
jgi:hypothetical protein